MTGAINPGGHADQTFGGELAEHVGYDGGGKGYANDEAREERGFLLANPLELREQHAHGDHGENGKYDLQRVENGFHNKSPHFRI